MKNHVFFLLAITLFGCTTDQPTQTASKPQKMILPPLATPDQMYPDLFQAVQLAQVFPDGKTFVDCLPKTDMATINQRYAEQKGQPDFDLKKFVHANFNEPISISKDFKSDMSRTAEEHVEALWPVLTRSADKAVAGSTLIPLPKDYIVPGGRFREVYYWDSYFTMLGLAIDGENRMIENILDNFAYLIDTVGHIPNGNRTYYRTRSQPPFFAQMVHLLAQQKGDAVYQKYADALKKEYAFWMKQQDGKPVFDRTVKTGLGILNRYFDYGTTPRQESYREDYEVVHEANGGTKMYVDLRAGAESGWDYTSRWFKDNKNMNTIQTTDILPVDLNALLYGMEEVLLKTTDDEAFADRLKNSMAARRQFVQEYCWKEDGSFEDYNWVTKETTGNKSLAMVYPLFFKMATQKQADAVAGYLQKHFLKPGGVVTTLYDTGQQWDAPNGWAPLQWMTVKGLDNYGHQTLAREIATRWTELNEKVYKNTGKFVEKYNVIDLTLEAGGGEYPVQDGFGWSNGVYLALKEYLGMRK